MVTLFTPTMIFASGFSIFEQGAKATGQGGAFTATADDPSAIFYNVAGIAYQREMAALTGATIITFDSQFTGSNDPYPGPGVREFYADHTFTPPNTYAIIPVGENATIGVGVFSAFGLRTNWENENRFSGRFISKDANLKTASVQPSFAWKTSDGSFAFGAGVEYRTSHVILEQNIPAINPFNQRIIDIAEARLDSDWNSDWGWSAGLMFRPSDTWSFGVSYRAAMDIDYEGEADFRQVSTGNAQLDAIIATQIPPDQSIATTVAYPAFLSVGVATTLVPNWTIEVNVNQQTWSRFEELRVDFSNPATPDLIREQNWEDTLSYRLGANRDITERWNVRLGAVYDENPQPTEVVGPLLPDADRYGVSFGIGYQGEHISVELSEFFLVFEDRSTEGRSADNFNGEYRTTANLIGINFGYTF